MTPRASPPGIEDMPAALLSFVVGKPGEQVARQNAVVAVEQALEARRSGAAHQGGHIPGAVGGGVRPQYLVLLTIATVHIVRRATAAADLFVLSTRRPRAWCR